MLNIASLFAPATSAQWIAQLIANANTLELPTTSWQAGGMVRTIIAVMGNVFSQEDAVISGMVQGGFLDFAATGTVTYTTTDGDTITQPVTPDPSIPSQNPTGAPGWLDVLANSVYNVQRIGAQQATNLLAIANASANTYGPYAAGGYHVANPLTGAAYSNAGALTINPGTYAGGAITGASNTTPIQVSTTNPHGLTTGQVVLVAGVAGNTAANGFAQVTVTSGNQFTLNGSSGNGSWTSGGTVLVAQTATFQCDVAGPTGTAGIGAITQPVTSNTGIQVYNYLPFFGSAFESNTALVVRCRAKIQSLSPNGPKGAYRYFALSAYQLLQEQTPPVLLSAPITRAVTLVLAATGTVNVYVASDSGAVSGCVQLGITGATNSTPIAITTLSAHGLSNGNFATLTGVTGNTAANGTWNITVTGPTTFTLNGSTGNAVYAGGGSLEGGDLGQVDAIIQANAVPDSVTETTSSAASWSVAVVATVLVPQAQVAAYTAAVQAGLALYFKSLPIGGNPSTPGVLQYNDIIGVIWAAGSLNGQPSYVQSIPALTLNGVAGNATFPSPLSVATLSTTLTIQGF